MIAVFTLIFVFALGYGAGKAAVAREAARELRELRDEFDALSAEAFALQARAEAAIGQPQREWAQVAHPCRQPLNESFPI